MIHKEGHKDSANRDIVMLNRILSLRKTANPLDVVHQPSKTDADLIWTTDAKSALLVNTLASENVLTSKNINDLLSTKSSQATSAGIFTGAIPGQQISVNDESNALSLPERLVNLVESKRVEAPQLAPTLGIFSDSKIYSALIKHELSSHQVQLKHFNHPKTLNPQNFDKLDQVGAWIVFLSEVENDDFLDVFFNRYSEKATLFLFEKMSRRQTSQKVAEFLQQNKLVTSNS
jgi:hypothetical protein